MIPEHIEDMFYEAGWVRDDSHRRFELVVEGTLCAVISYDEIRLMSRIDNEDHFRVIIDQAAERFIFERDDEADKS